MATSEVRACFVCEDEEVGNEATLIACTCGRHHICIECLRHGVQAVLADESCHPLRCADNSCPPVSSELLLYHLAAPTDPKDADLCERLEFKLEEYNTPRAERVYCNNPSCITKHGVSLFLNPRLYDRDGFDHWGVNRQGRDREGYDEEGLDIHLFYRDGHDRFGIHRSWYPGHDDEGGLTFNVFGYDQDGYNREGRDMDGLDREGMDVEGYNYCGMDKWGRYRNGLRYNGYTYHHRDLQGNIEPGYRLMPDGNVRIDHVCNTYWCPCELEREPSSANICAICRLTIEEGQLTHDFETNSGPVHDTCHKLADEDYVTVWMMSDWERAGFLGLAEMIARLEDGKEEHIAVAEK